MRDSDAAAALHALGLPPERAAVVALLPLVEVAWQDGTVDIRERAVLEAVAEELGLEPSITDEQPLAGWLAVAPSPALYAQARAVLTELVRLPPPLGPRLSESVLQRTGERCRRIAEAGGEMGALGALTPRSLSLIARILEDLAFHVARCEARQTGATPPPQVLPEAEAGAATYFDPESLADVFDDLGEPAPAHEDGEPLGPDEAHGDDATFDSSILGEAPGQATTLERGDRAGVAALTLLADVVWATGRAEPLRLGWLLALATEWGVDPGLRAEWAQGGPDRSRVDAAHAQLGLHPLGPERAARLSRHVDAMLSHGPRADLVTRARAEDLEARLRSGAAGRRED